MANNERTLLLFTFHNSLREALSPRNFAAFLLVLFDGTASRQRKKNEEI
jgi:hypothetical protein